ncbi:MAG: hypothetical protein HN820_09175 [Candidatus Marinimicrobia bacterium]|nr:hypothetical protein [Candidatus Neomarinimicrobiota bacterium]
MRKFLPLLLTFAFSTDFHWEAITSLINPTDVQFVDDGNIYATTNGGVIKFNLDAQSFTEIGFDEGLWPLDLSSIYVDDIYLWVTDIDGSLQTYNIDSGTIDKISHLDFIDSITDLNPTEYSIFAIGHGNTQDGLLQFSRENGDVHYENYFQNFPVAFSQIYDIHIVEDSIYVALDSGLISASVNSTSLYLSSEWKKRDSSGPIYQIANKYYFTGDSIKHLVDKDFYSEINSVAIGSKYDSESSTLNWVDEANFYELKLDKNNELWQFENPFNPSESDSVYVAITSFDRSGDDIVIGVQNHGLTHVLRETGQVSTYIPNSILTNKLSALSITKDGNLTGVGREGGIYQRGERMTNFYSYAFGYDYPNWGEGYDAFKFKYKVGDYFPRSIIESDRGTYLFNNYGRILDSENKSGGIIEFDPITRDVTIFGKDDGTLDGTGGIVDSNSGSWYSQIPQLKKDIYGNIWALNAFAEHTNQIAAIQKMDGSWVHVTAPDTNSYLPIEFDFGPNGFVWFGFQRHDNPYDYVSSGGIKILNTRNTLNDSTDDIWLMLSHPDTLPGGLNQDVYSLAFSKTEGQDVLWVMGNSGVQGYLVSGTNLTAIYPQEFYGNLGFTKVDRLKVDPQNNIWIITQHSGIRVIKSNTERWPTEDGFTTENSELLSNIVYDIAFDDVSGRAFIATDSGISILHIPFGSEPHENNDTEILMSPNPIYLPSELGLSIFSFPSGATIKVMTLTGRILKSFNLDDNENIINSWDCRMDNGNLLSSGIYLVASSHPENGNRVGKLAVIRK